MRLCQEPLLIVIILPMLSGCQYDPHTSEYTAAESSPPPQSADLVSTYSPTRETRDLIVNQGHYRPVSTSIRLSPDGTFQFKSVPGWWLAAFQEWLTDNQARLSGTTSASRSWDRLRIFRGRATPRKTTCPR